MGSYFRGVIQNMPLTEGQVSILMSCCDNPIGISSARHYTEDHKHLELEGYIIYEHSSHGNDIRITRKGFEALLNKGV